MGSPLNPRARKVGKRSAVAEVTHAVVSGIAAASRNSDGLVEVDIEGTKFTINDTDKIQEQVDRVLRNLGK